MLQNGVSHRCGCVKESKYQGEVSHHCGGVLTSLRRYRAIWATKPRQHIINLAGWPKWPRTACHRAHPCKIGMSQDHIVPMQSTKPFETRDYSLKHTSRTPSADKKMKRVFLGVDDFHIIFRALACSCGSGSEFWGVLSGFEVFFAFCMEAA